MTLRQLLEEHLSAALQEAGAPPGTPALVGPATRPEFGDYQANGVMAVAKRLKTNPRQLAEKVIGALDADGLIETAEVAGPGFINIALDNAWLAEYLGRALADERLGVDRAESPQKIVVDYSAPNLAKEMHVGHLRTTVIGDALVRVLEFLGHQVIRHNHVGDWGTQFGMLIAYMDRLEQEGRDVLSAELGDLEKFYQSARKLFDDDPEFADLSRKNVVKLQGGDARCRRMWQHFIEESLRHCQQVYDRLGITLSPADVRGESAYNDDLSQVVEELRQKNLLTESAGAQCVFLDEFKKKDGEILPVIVQKSDGGYLYSTSDLAAVRYRSQVLGVDRILYIVDARQSLHLQQIFATARAAGFAAENISLEHHSFGTIKGKDGKPFGTRKGGLVKLMDLLEEAEERAFDMVGEKNPDLPGEQRREIARTIGISSIKYADLSLNRTTDYIYDWNRMLSLEGNTAPYLQYSYTRVQSIFRRGGLDEISADACLLIAEKAERALAVKLAQFAEAVEVVSRDCYPNLLCNYLCELAEAFMRFYESCPVLKADEPVRTSRLQLCRLAARTIQMGLGLLGIETVERM